MKENNQSEKKNTAGCNLTVSYFRLLITIFIMSASVGSSIALLATPYLSKRIVVIDIEKIINMRKDEFTKKYSQRDVSDADTKKEMSADIKDFAEKLESALANEPFNSIILNKGAVVSNADDITEIVIHRIWEK